ncbi:MAG: hypothetical protein AB8I08_39875 [Sandaracinaceae bacterium]
MAASPLLGYNTNVRHLGKLYHIQTEDSGSSHGHIFTHLFADGGRIIASKKTTYSQYVGTARYPAVVKQLMRESHKAMFIALRDGLFDEDEAAGAKAMTAMQITLPEESDGTSKPPAEPDVDALERAAAAKLAESGGRYQSTKPAAPAASQPPSGQAAASQAPRGPSAPAAPPSAQLPPRPAASAPAVQPFAKKQPEARPDPQSESIFGGDLLSEKSLDEVILSYLAEDVDE